jgi:hypothetical protein
LTFCGDLLNAPAGCYLRSQGRKRVRPGEAVHAGREKFLRVQAKVFMAVRQLWTARRRCVSAPAKGLKIEKARNEQEPVHDERAGENGVATSPAAVCRGAKAQVTARKGGAS